jgi:hypothetical protein
MGPTAEDEEAWDEAYGREHPNGTPPTSVKMPWEDMTEREFRGSRYDPEC